MKIMVAFLGNKKNNSNIIVNNNNNNRISGNKLSSIKNESNKVNEFSKVNKFNSINSFGRSNTRGKSINSYENNRISKIKRDTIKSINSISELKSTKNIKDFKNIKDLSCNKVNQNIKSSLSEFKDNKFFENGFKSVIYANVVSNPNISFKYKKLNKKKVIARINELLNYKNIGKSNYKNNNADINSIKKSKRTKYNNYYNKKNCTSDIKVVNLINFMLIFIPLVTIIFSNNLLASKILVSFTTNFRQAEKINFQVTDLVKNYSLYNLNNYIIYDKIETIVEKADNTYLDKNQQVIVTSDEEIIDKEAQIEDIAAFFGNEQINVEITENSSSIQRVTIGGTKILNYSSKRDIDFAALINSEVILTKKSDKILLYNTHTSETYTNSDGYQFGYTGTMRTTDAMYNMIAIAKKFSENLNLKGFSSVQDTTPHDYGTYTSAYSKSRITVKNALETMSGAGIIIDVHRDASSDLSYRPVANIKGVQVAQLMFVVGVGSNSSPNNYWQDNLKLALKLQQMADKVYPGLFRPMIIRNSVYNQDLNKYALLIEFGATGNTIEEVKLSTRCMTNLLNIMYKD